MTSKHAPASGARAVAAHVIPSELIAASEQLRGAVARAQFLAALERELLRAAVRVARDVVRALPAVAESSDLVASKH